MGAMKKVRYIATPWAYLKLDHIKNPLKKISRLCTFKFYLNCLIITKNGKIENSIQL